MNDYEIEVLADGTGMFGSLADKGMWDSKRMRLVGLPPTPERPFSTVGVLAKTPNDQFVYIETKLDMMRRAVEELFHDHVTRHGVATFHVTFELAHHHGDNVVPCTFSMDVTSPNAVNAISTATTMLRTFYTGHVNDVQCKKVTPKKE